MCANLPFRFLLNASEIPETERFSNAATEADTLRYTIDVSVRHSRTRSSRRFGRELVCGGRGRAKYNNNNSCDRILLTNQWIFGLSKGKHHLAWGFSCIRCAKCEYWISVVSIVSMLHRESVLEHSSMALQCSLRSE